MFRLSVSAFTSGDCDVNGTYVGHMNQDQLETFRRWVLYLILVYSVEMRRRCMPIGNLEPGVEPDYVQIMKDCHHEETRRQNAGRGGYRT